MNNKERHRTNPKSFLKRVWNNIKLRCTVATASTSKYYYGLSYCNKEEFINKFLNDATFNNLFNDWKNYNYSYEKTPSIDRIDKTQGYFLENLQFIHLDKNCGKEKNKLPILMFDKDGYSGFSSEFVFDKDGNFIKEFESKWQAHKELNIPNGNICKCVYGKRKTAGGYVFKFK